MAEKVIATNESDYGWEYFSDRRVAKVYLNERTGQLRLEITGHTKDTGINSYEKNDVLERVSLGDVGRPNLKKVSSLLKKHTHQRSRASSPFNRQWTNASGQKMSLGKIVAQYKNAGVTNDDDRKRREIVKKIQNLSGGELDALLGIVRMGSVSDRVASRFVERFGVEE